MKEAMEMDIILSLRQQIEAFALEIERLKETEKALQAEKGRCERALAILEKVKR